MIKVFVVVGNKCVYGIYTNKEEAKKHADHINLCDEMGGGKGFVACVKEVDFEMEV